MIFENTLLFGNVSSDGQHRNIEAAATANQRGVVGWLGWRVGWLQGWLVGWLGWAGLVIGWLMDWLIDNELVFAFFSRSSKQHVVVFFLLAKTNQHFYFCARLCSTGWLVG